MDCVRSQKIWTGASKANTMLPGVVLVCLSTTLEGLVLFHTQLNTHTMVVCANAEH